VTRQPSPYKGLASFDDSEHDALLFFGREREREIIAANLMASRLTVLYGETGVGKSSILQAGVVRHLRGMPDPGVVVIFDDWQDDPAASLRREIAAVSGLEPAATLADTLEAAAAVAGGEVLVILDGFEEYFLYHGSEAGAGSFLEDFSEAVTRPGLHAGFLVAIREDALAKIDRFKGRIPNLFGNYLRLDHLDRTAGREAIRGPVDRYNELDGDGKVEIEPALVEAVLDQVAAGKVELGRSGRGAPGNGAAAERIEAPFLQLVMTRLWDAEADGGSRTLRLATLVGLGGAEQIVRDHLEGALAALDPDQQDIAAAIFNQLVTPSGAKIAHDASDLAGYLRVAPDAVEPVLAALAAERILRPVPGRPGSELPRYEIYHDILGAAVLAWCARHESEREVERVRDAAARRHRRLLAIAGGAVLVAAAMIGLTILALTKRSEADSQARRAKARALDASALVQLQVDPELSLALAVEAAKHDRGGQAEDVLRRALLASRVRGRFTANGPVVAARYSPDGSKILVAGGSEARVYDSESRRQLLVLDQKAPITAADFSPTGRVIVTAGNDGRVRIWSAQTGQLLRTLRNGAAVRSARFDQGGSRLVAAGGHVVNAWRVADGSRLFTHRFDWPVTGAVFGHDGRKLVVIGNHPSALLYSVPGARLVRSLRQGDFVTDAAFSPDGTRLVTGGRNRLAVIWNVRTGRRLQALPHPDGEVLAVAFSPDGRNVATASSDGFGRIWDVSKGTLVAPLIGHSHFVVAVAYSGDGNSLVTSSTDGTARVWDAHSGKFLTLLAGDGDSVTQAYFSPNGRRVLTGSDDGTARLWDPQIQPQLRPVAALPGPIAGASYLPGGLVLTAGPGRAAWLVRTSDGRTVRKFRVGKNVTAAAATPDLQRIAVASGTTVSLFNGSGKRIRSFSQPKVVEAVALSGDQLATGGTDGVIRIWSLAKGGAPRELHGHTKTITDVAFSPDGRLLASASRDATARIWDPASGKKLRVLAQNKNDVNSVAFSPDGRSLLTASKDADAKIWDVATGTRRQLLRWHFGAVNDAEFSPDGQWIVTTGPVTLQLWQPAVREPLFRLGVKGPGGMLAAVFDPASERLSAVTGDGRLLTYRCTICGGLAKLLPVARSHLSLTGRALTATERKRYEG
jgi:WD40 repeat protein